MAKIEVPKALAKLTKKNLERDKPNSDGEALLFLRNFSDFSLYIFGTPIAARKYEEERFKNSFEMIPQGDLRLEWFIRRARKKGKDLWESFSENLVMLRLCDGEYEVSCGQAFAINSMGVEYDNAYRLRMGNKRNLRSALYFAAREMVRLAGFKDIPEEEIRRLRDFLIEDLRTQKYHKKSQEIGSIADSIFFSGPLI